QPELVPQFDLVTFSIACRLESAVRNREEQMFHVAATDPSFQVAMTQSHFALCKRQAVHRGALHARLYRSRAQLQAQSMVLIYPVVRLFHWPKNFHFNLHLYLRPTISDAICVVSLP